MAQLATAQSIQFLNLAYFGRPADPASLSAWPASGLTDEAVVLQFVNTAEYIANTVALNSAPNPGGTPTFNDTTLINTFYLRLFGRLAVASEVAGWSDALARGAVNYDYLGITILNAGLNLPADTEMRQVLVAKFDSAQLYTGILFNSPESAAAYSTAAAIQDGISFNLSTTTPTPQTFEQAQAAVATMVTESGAGGGQTFTLTTAIEQVPATGNMPANSTVNGVIANGAANGQTFQTGDTINGNATSSLNVTISQAGNVIATVNNMGTANFRTFAQDTVNNILFTGVGAVNNVGGTAALTVTNGALATTYGVVNPTTDAGDLTVGIRAADITGADDTLAFAVTGAVAGISLTNNNAGIENVSVATTGDNAFTVSRNAAARDGVLTVTGAGTNTVTVANQYASNASFIGTGGTNTLVLGGAGSPAFVNNITLTDFAGLNFAGGTASNLVFAAGATTPVVGLLEGNNTVVAVTRLGSVETINLIGNGGAGATSLFGAFTVNSAYTGTDDTVAISAGNGGTAKTGAFGYTLAGDLILNGAENINLTVADIAATGVTALSAGAVTSNALSTFTVTTPGNLTGAGGDIVAGATTLTAVDFSGVAGTANIGTQTFNMANGGTITGSVGDFTGAFNTLDTAASTYTFNGNDAVDTVNFTGSAGIVNINTLAGDDAITGSTGGGVFTPGVGVDTVDLTGTAGVASVRFALGDSGITATTIDTITAFNATGGAAGDTLGFGLFAGTAANFGRSIAADSTYAQALTLANTIINGAGRIYAFVRGANVNSGFIFVDYDGDDTIDLAAAVNGANIATANNAALFNFGNIVA